MTSPASPVRVRFAPSPTGLLHIGGLRTALYNYLLARQSGGVFILRIEDTDRSRFVEEAQEDILTSLAWAGLKVDEGPEAGGPHAPYYQSQRRDLYQKYADHLVANGHAYLAFDTPEQWQEEKARLEAAGVHSPRYDRSVRAKMPTSLSLSADEVTRRIDAGEPYVIRLNVPEGEMISFTDAVRGDVSISTDQIDDQVLMKSDGLPTYHLANVVDDHEMQITHIIRGEEWLPSVPKHLLLYRFLGWEPPQMAHLPLILSPTGGKLSKRNAEKQGIPVSVRDYISAGYEPEALLNFLAFLGWNPGTDEELFSLPELTAAFSLDRVGSAGVQFSMEKLRWYNEQYMRSKDHADLAARLQPLVQDAGWACDEGYLTRVVSVLIERVSFAHEILEAGSYFFDDPAAFDAKAVAKRWKDTTPGTLLAFRERLESVDSFDATTLSDVLHAFMEDHEIGFGAIMPGLRLCVSGEAGGPDLFATMEILGKDTVQRRIREGITRINELRSTG